MIQKNQRLRLSCERLGSELEGVCLNEGMPVFVPGVLPGEEADVLCVKVQPRYALWPPDGGAHSFARPC